ncbi:MAG: hypothetical protein ABII06_05135 [Pseudomonadota bacterium]
MFFKKHKAKTSNRIMDVDKVLYEIIGDEWNKIPPTGDHWVKYKAAVRQHLNDSEVFDVRIFDEWYVKEKKVKVVDFSSLDDKPELIILQGWFNRESKKGDVKLRKVA